MKNSAKRIFILLLVFVQLVLLCGCDALDEMRQNHAFFNEDGDIVWNGSIYKKLPDCEYLVPLCSYDTIVYVTEEDVPVLLSSMLSQYDYYPSDDRRFLLEYSYEEGACYCEVSIYDAVCARILEPFEADIICYSYDVFQEDFYEYDTRYYTLTQEQVDAIKLVVEKTEPTIMQDGMQLNSEWSVCLEESSEDMIFRRNIMDISYASSIYYLHLYTNNGQLLFTVPEGCNGIFGEIVKEYLAAEEEFAWDEDSFDI